MQLSQSHNFLMEFSSFCNCTQKVGRMHLIRNRISLRHHRLPLVLAVFTVASICAHVVHLRLGNRRQFSCDSIEARQPALTINKDVKLPTVCPNLTCKSAYLRHLHNYGYFPVPALRHLLWRSENVSEYFARQLSTRQRIHPDWAVVLWRDQDLEPFVSKYFPGAFPRFLELAAHPIMQVDMIRYMLLYKYGGVYADLDYKLASSLDEHRQFYAVVTREPEAHSLQFLGMNWPVKAMASPAFLMSAPGHAFFRYCIEWLQTVPYTVGSPLSFAGPLGLTDIVETYDRLFPVANSPMETVYIPPSYSFHPYDNNRMTTAKSAYLPHRLSNLRFLCKQLGKAEAKELLEYCKDVNNMDLITDPSHPVIAVHDMQKSGAIYDGTGNKFYLQNMTSAKRVLPRLQLGQDWT